MDAVARLRTFVDIDEADDDGPDAARMSVTARHEAVLADGRRVVLLDDRGWSGRLSGTTGDDLRGIWAFQTVEEMTRTARDVVGPDEPFDDRSQADMEASHWAALARILRDRGIAAEPAALEALPHDVVLSDRVLARIGRAPPDAPSGER